MLEQLPRLLKALRDGLASAAFDPFSSRDFFVRLQALHVRPPDGEGLLEVREPFVFSVLPPDSAEGLADDDPDLLKVRQLRLGSWVVFQQDQADALRCKLLAIMAPAAIPIFLSAARGSRSWRKTPANWRGRSSAAHCIPWTMGHCSNAR